MTQPKNQGQDDRRSAARWSTRTGEGGFDMPRHVAIIMDGNGRWAAARGLPRVEGHRRGVEALRKTVRAASDLGIAVLTIFSFSSENWSRPQSEIRDLLSLLRRFIRNDLADLHKSNVLRPHHRRARRPFARHPQPSRRGGRPHAATMTVSRLWWRSITAHGRKSRARRAASRRSRARAACRRRRSRRSSLARHLDAPDIPDPDVIIRTSGEQRLSNFLLWQAAYSELVFVPLHWPDFDRAALEGAIAEYPPARAALWRLDRSDRIVITLDRHDPGADGTVAAEPAATRAIFMRRLGFRLGAGADQRSQLAYLGGWLFSGPLHARGAGSSFGNGPSLRLSRRRAASIGAWSCGLALGHRRLPGQGGRRRHRHNRAWGVRWPARRWRLGRARRYCAADPAGMGGWAAWSMPASRYLGPALLRGDRATGLCGARFSCSPSSGRPTFWPIWSAAPSAARCFGRR